jgi:hypothetical protein
MDIDFAKLYPPQEDHFLINGIKPDYIIALNVYRYLSIQWLLALLVFGFQQNCYSTRV